jgi:hypothetical protein
MCSHRIRARRTCIARTMLPQRTVFRHNSIAVNSVPSADSTSRGVAAGRSAQRGTSGAATGGGGRSAPDPEHVMANVTLVRSVLRRAQK